MIEFSCILKVEIKGLDMKKREKVFSHISLGLDRPTNQLSWS